jgi:hypothetical protein
MSCRNQSDEHDSLNQRRSALHNAQGHCGLFELVCLHQHHAKSISRFYPQVRCRLNPSNRYTGIYLDPSHKRFR